MRRRLSEVKRIMKEKKFFRAEIIGHADHTGDSAVNEKISKQRAQHVRARLVDDIDASRIISLRGNI